MKVKMTEWLKWSGLAVVLALGELARHVVPTEHRNG